MTWTYTNSLATDRDRVRFLLQDTVTARQLLQDEEIAWALSTEANIYIAAALCADTLAGRARGLTSKTVGDLSLSYSAQEWSAVASRLRARGSAYMLPSAGGVLLADRDAIWADTSLLRPSFYADLHQDPNTITARDVDEEEEP